MTTCGLVYLPAFLNEHLYPPPPHPHSTYRAQAMILAAALALFSVLTGSHAEPWSALEFTPEQISVSAQKKNPKKTCLNDKNTSVQHISPPKAFSQFFFIH